LLIRNYFFRKRELCEKKRNFPSIKGRELAEDFGISEQAVSKILKRSSHWLRLELESTTARFKRDRKSTFPEIEEAMIIWVDQAIAQGLTLQGHMVQEKAKWFAGRLGVKAFNASDGWLAKFKKRNRLSSYKRRGESASAPIEEIPRFRAELQEVLHEYSPENIFNCDETALFWKLEPSRTLAHGPVAGKKMSKDRVSIMVTCSSMGEKLPLLFIHKFKTPVALRGIDKNTLPVWYYFNNKAWMQRSVFAHYLNRLNSIMHRANRHILLLMDNAKCHETENLETLSNVRVYFLPPNTTSYLQPINQGIIYSLKVL